MVNSKLITQAVVGKNAEYSDTRNTMRLSLFNEQGKSLDFSAGGQAAGVAGYSVPNGWGEIYLPKMRSGNLSVLTAVGDSVDAGYNANTRDQGYLGKIVKDLQFAYGDGGSGVFGTERSDVLSATNAGYTDRIVTTGTWISGANVSGPGGYSILSAVTDSTATLHVRGSKIRILWWRNTGLGTFSYKIDGSSPVEVVTEGASGVGITEVDVSSGDHTVVLTKTATNTGPIGIWDVWAGETDGVRLNNYAAPGADSSLVGASYTYSDYSGGVLDPDTPDLVIVGFGPNDASGSVTPDSLSQNIGNYLNKILEKQPTDILFVIKHVGKHDSSPPKYPAIAARYRELADIYNAAYVDIWTLFSNNWRSMNEIQGWGNTTTPGIPGDETIHLSNIGHAAQANLIYPIVSGTDPRFNFAV